MIYLDCAATTPVDPRVAEVAIHYLIDEYGNSGSNTHELGLRARAAVQEARTSIASLAAAQPDEMFFTSGATEANNLVSLGLLEWMSERTTPHVLTTRIEHKSVLEPFEQLARRGIEVEYIPVDASGRIDSEMLQERLRDTTCLVSVMHVNNETGVEQPIAEIADLLADHPAYLHTDAAQSFGKLSGLEDQRIDLITASGHKLYAPKGIGALIARKRGYARPPLKPLVFGGGQERGLRPGTLPVHLCAAFGKAAEIAAQERYTWNERCVAVRAEALRAFATIGAEANGDSGHAIASTLNVSFPGVSSEAAILTLKGLVALSNGSACTSASYEPSHVLTAMGLSEDRVMGALRFSWSHLTPGVPWDEVAGRLKRLM